MDEAEISNGWRLCEELTVKQAALLYAGFDPASNEGTFCEGWKPHERPAGYEAAKQSISSALRKGKISGTNVEIEQTDWNGNPAGYIPNTTDINASDVDRDSLVQWLRLKGVTTGFFFPAVTDTPGYLDPAHLRYAPKLAAAVLVWQAMEDENLRKTGKPIADMTTWLESRYKEFGLVHKQGGKNKDGEATHKIGDRNGGAIEQVCKVANWEIEGRAPTTPGGQPTHPTD